MTKKDLYILMLEDNELDAELNQEQLLLLEDYNCVVKLIQDKESFIKEINACPQPELILCDYNLPSYNGMEALKDLNSHKLNIPFIFVTGTMQEEVAVDAIKAGAWDYVVKDRLFRLPLAITSVLKLKKEKDIAVEADKRAQRLIRGIDETSMQVVVIDKDFKIDYVNQNFTKISGKKPDEILGEPLSAIYPEEKKQLSKKIYHILNQKKSYQGDLKVIRADGIEYWEHITVTPIFNEQGEIKSYTLIAENITEQKELEENLIKSLKELEIQKKKAEESDNLKTAFLANLSHEIRTPMNGILGFAGLIKSENISPDTISVYINIIEQSGQRMLSLINDLVDISKIEAGQIVNEPQETNLNNLMEELCRFFMPQANKKNIELICKKGLPETDFSIFIDKVKLEQVLSNLISNALKFTKRGFVEFKYSVSEKHLFFSVKDTGIGIPSGLEDIVFERFRQADNNYLKETEGSGLGLSISKSFIEKMGGKIWVESEEGKGSEFFIDLPFDSITQSNEGADIDQEYSFDKVVTVLIAEDDEISRLYIEQVLPHEKFKLLHAKNGKEAIQIFEDHPEVQLILMDLKLPVMNGLNATREVRKKNSKIPIIAQTAYASEIDKKNALLAGCNDFITKPVKKDILLKKIEKALISV